MGMPLKSLLLFAAGTLLLVDCVYLVTVKVTHLGVILPALIGLAMVTLALWGKPWQAWLEAHPWGVIAWRVVLAWFFIWLASLLLFFWVLQKLRPVAGADVNPRVIVVLGSSTPNGKASPTLTERLKLAATLAQQYPQAAVVVSGGTDFGQQVSEARVMADDLVAMGVDAKRITLEDRSTSTHENLLFSARVVEPAGIRRDAPMLLVTSDFHTARASWIAAKVGWTQVQAAGALTPLYMRYNAWTREYFACLSGWLHGEY